MPSGRDFPSKPPPVIYSKAKIRTRRPLEIIPVLDIKSGTVVHARRGARKDYLPLQSRLTPSAQPLAVLGALLDRYPFRRVYLADLDAIAGKPSPHLAAIQEMRQRFPGLEFWIDAGVRELEGLQDFLAAHLGTPVLGSETLRDITLLQAPEARSAVLSLDYLGERFLGPAALEAAHERWPQTVILMQLERVGAEAGPDLERLAALRRRVPDRRLYAAGGVRDDEDLRRLEELGVDGVLVATALHHGALSASRPSL